MPVNIGLGLTLARISGSTFSTVQHMQDIFHSAGWVSGGGITDDADGTITVAIGTGLIRATDSPTAQILFTDWSAEAGANVSLADNDISWIYVEYNAGSPRVIATITERNDFNTNILLGIIQRSGTTLHINTEDKHVVGDHANDMIRRLKGTSPFAQVSGSIVSETGTRNVALTAGSFWQGLTEFTTAAFDSSGADRFSYFYSDGSGGFTEVTSQAQIDNTRWDDGDGTLGTVSNNKYGVHWVYQEVDDDISVLYGTGDYTLAEAEDAQPPAAIPERITTQGYLVGKIIIEKNAATFTQIESAFQTTFAGSLAQDHGNLIGLSGDDHTQYLLADGSRVLTADWDAGSFKITAETFASDIATGTAPFTVASTTAVTNLQSATVATIAGLAPDTATTQATQPNITSVAALPWTGMKIGIDGEVPTFDASGNPAFVAVGTSTHVLTSNGVGTAPTFQAASGGGANTALSNLSSVSINESLISDTDITDDLGTGDVRWKDAWIETLSSGLTATDVLKLRARDVDGSAYVDILTITSNNTVTADLNALVTIGGNAIANSATTTLSSLVSISTITTGVWNGTDIAVADGGTGSSTASGGLSNLGGIGAATTDTLTNKTFDANGTGNSLSNVDVADLANGTDGELITWSAAAAPTTVAVGSSGEVLTSNGVGAAPTFQAGAGGGADLVVMVFPGQGFPGTTWAVNIIDNVPCWTSPGSSATHSLYVSTKVPAGATSISSIRIIYRREITGDVYLDFQTFSYDRSAFPVAQIADFTDNPTPYTSGAADSSVDAFTVPSGAYNVHSIAENDIFALKILRDSTHADDTYEGIWRIFAIEFTFA